MGPWAHGGWGSGAGDRLGAVRFDAATAASYREYLEFPFFEQHLKGRGQWAAPGAIVFETGRNQWRRHDTWPPAEAKPRSIFLQPGGKLAFTPPVPVGAPAPRGEPDSREEFDEYVSDPARPVPYTSVTDIDCPREFMVEDQRFTSRRPDVLLYETEPLRRNLTVAGPIQVELHVSTSGTDTDWVAKVIDVYPDDTPDPEPHEGGVVLGGYQQLVRGDVMRGKFRDSFEKPAPFRPNEPAVVRFTLQDVYHTFRTGHRLMVQVQSSWFPLVDRNPQTFVDIYTAKASDFRKATQRVYHTDNRPSRLELLVLP
jgi:putative CocE/NonD family hydrolase